MYKFKKNHICIFARSRISHAKSKLAWSIHFRFISFSIFKCNFVFFKYLVSSILEYILNVEIYVSKIYSLISYIDKGEHMTESRQKNEIVV